MYLEAGGARIITCISPSNSCGRFSPFLLQALSQFYLF
jgi:hypothetical protein